MQPLFQNHQEVLELQQRLPNFALRVVPIRQYDFQTSFIDASDDCVLILIG